jgi:hypothetical protein
VAHIQHPLVRGCCFHKTEITLWTKNLVNWIILIIHEMIIHVELFSVANGI